MTITLEEEEVEEEEEEGGDCNSDDSEEEEEAEEEVEREKEREEEREKALAVASISKEVLAPSLGDSFDFDWGQVTDWMAKENAARSQQTMPQTHETTPQQPTIEKSTDHIEQTTTVQTELPTLQETTDQHSTNEATTSHQILIPAHNSQTQTIINLKDRISREQKLQQDSLQQIEILQNKLKAADKKYNELKCRDEDRKTEEEALNRARNVLNVRLAKVERRENAVKEIDTRIQREKKEMWQNREKLDAEKELVRTEWEKMKVEREKMETEKKKLQEESEKMRAREDDLKHKGRSLQRLFEDIKEESRKAKESKSLIHVPLQNGLIAGDPFIQAMPMEIKDCFNTGACGHIKVTHKGALTLSSWHNKRQKRNITNLLNGSGSEDEENPSKKSRSQ